MPIILPEHLNTAPQVIEFEGVRNRRVINYQVDLLDKHDNYKVINLEGVLPQGSLRFSARASVKGRGEISFRDLGRNIDWLNSRLLIWCITKDDYKPEVKTPVGVFLAAAPIAEWKDGKRIWNIELTDKSSILDTDIITNIDGEAVTYSLAEDVNVIDAVQEIIGGAGEVTPAIQFDEEANLSGPMTWEAGTTRLKIVNDLLSAANYFSIWCDGMGQFQATKYMKPARRPILYQALKPFTEGASAVMEPEWTHDRDIYSVPNRYVALQQGDDEKEGLWATATIKDPDSPFSFESRGRWVTEIEDGVEAVSQTALDAYAERKLESMTSISSKISISHMYLPKLLVNAVMRFTVADVDILASVTNTEISLNPSTLVKTSLKEVMADDDGEQLDEQ